MRTLILLASTALAAAALVAGPAAADDHLNLTPPLYREQARATQQTRPNADLTTTPQPVPAVGLPGLGRSAAAARTIVEAAAR